jgi:type III secretory pathway lipoprotein EscJ|tara:strand:+ start:1273 stop:1452 length:180 start_codon:yes stop_codon:yes gene_type:complete
MKLINILSDCSKKDAEMVQVKLELHGVKATLTGGNKKGANMELQIKEEDLEKAIAILKE